MRTAEAVALLVSHCHSTSGTQDCGSSKRDAKHVYFSFFKRYTHYFSTTVVRGSLNVS